MEKLMIVLTLIVMIGSNPFGYLLMNVMTEGPAGPATSRCYKGIMIQKGGGLQAIAKEYSQDTELSVKEHVDRLKRMNGLKGDTVHVGNRLTVMYLVVAEQMKQRIQWMLVRN